jgi:hypothetical protein
MATPWHQIGIDQKPASMLQCCIMTKIKKQIRTRNWVAKHNFNRPVRHRDATQYQRQPKHRTKEQANEH